MSQRRVESISSGSDPLAPYSATPAELRTLLAVQRAGKPYLVLRGSQQELVLHSLDSLDPRQTIGRRRANTLCISWDTEVSSVHAELVSTSEEWIIVDDGISTNGTFVNGERVYGRRRLRDRDRLRVGRTVIVFHAGSAVRFTLTALGGDQLVPRQITAAQQRVLVALCRPYLHDQFVAPATNRQIADELCVTENAVKAHLRALFELFEIKELPQNEKRAKLAALAMRYDFVPRSDAP